MIETEHLHITMQHTTTIRAPKLARQKSALRQSQNYLTYAVWANPDELSVVLGDTH
jgi:hypothetical protein